MTSTNSARLSTKLAIDETKRLAEKIARGAGGREVALASTKLEEAGMWLYAAQHQLSKETSTKED